MQKFTDSTYVNNLLKRLTNVKEKGNGGWNSQCPCPTHGKNGVDDSKDSLGIDINEEGHILLVCRASCKTPQVLQAINCSFRSLRPLDGEKPHEATVESTQGSANASLSNQIWSYVLQQICPLTPGASDVAQKKYGFTPDQLREMGYGSSTKHGGAILGSLPASWQAQLEGLPGLRKNDKGDPAFKSDPFNRLLIPTRDWYGRILGFKARALNDQDKPRYQVHGEHMAHYPMHKEGFQPERIRITEGECKADYATLHTSTYTVSIPGVNSWALLEGVLEQVQPKQVILSWDWPDIKKSKAIHYHLEECLHWLVKELGEENVALETWPDAYKGIDDALRASIKPTVIWTLVDIQKELARIGHDHEAYVLNSLASAEVPPFPVEVFSPGVRAYIELTARSMQTSTDFSGCAVLTVASRAIGATRAIRLGAGWKECPNLYMILIAPPSSLKTPTLNKVLTPLSDQQELDNIYRESKLAQWHKDHAAWKENGKTSPEPIKPVHFRRLYSSNSTTEAMVLCLVQNYKSHRHDPSFFYCPDEITSLVSSMNAYRGGKGSDLDFFLSAWSGANIAYNRKTNDEIIFVKSPILSIMGGVQPDRVSDLSPAVGVDDGFLARFLFSFPIIRAGFKGHVAPEQAVTESQNDAAMAFWKAVIAQLLHLEAGYEHQYIPDPDRYPPGFVGPPEPIQVVTHFPVVSEMTDEAQEEWLTWLDRNEEELNRPLLPRYLVSWLGKSRSYIGRLALILRYLRLAEQGALFPGASAQVELEDLRGAIVLLHYFQHHFGKIQAVALTPEEQKAWALCETISREYGGHIKIVDIYRKHRLCGIRKADLCKRLLYIAENRQWGHTVKSDPKIGAPSKIFVLGPNLKEE